MAPILQHYLINGRNYHFNIIYNVLSSITTKNFTLNCSFFLFFFLFNDFLLSTITITIQNNKWHDQLLWSIPRHICFNFIILFAHHSLWNEKLVAIYFSLQFSAIFSLFFGPAIIHLDHFVFSPWQTSEMLCKELNSYLDNIFSVCPILRWSTWIRLKCHVDQCGSSLQNSKMPDSLYCKVVTEYFLLREW